MFYAQLPIGMSQLQPPTLSAASNQETSRKNRKSLMESAGEVGTLVGVCMEALTCTPRLTGCQRLRSFQKACLWVGRAAPGSSSTPPPRRLPAPAGSHPLSHCSSLTLDVSLWSSVPRGLPVSGPPSLLLGLTQPLNTKTCDGFISVGLRRLPSLY